MKVGDERPANAHQIQAVVTEKLLIFTRCHRVDQRLRNLIEFNEAASLPGLAGNACEQFSRAVVDLCRVLEYVAVEALINYSAVPVICPNGERSGNSTEHSTNDDRYLKCTRPHNAVRQWNQSHVPLKVHTRFHRNPRQT